MSASVQTPSADRLINAAKMFDNENQAVEASLAELFTQYPDNNKLAQVFLKVVAVNVLYGTQIPLYSDRKPTVEQVAQHIVTRGIDSALENGDAEIVDGIALITPVGKKAWNNFSFATKYCSWHRPKAYPIYDSRVEKYLRFLNRSREIPGWEHPDHWNYPKFREIVESVRTQYGLQEFTFKQLDKFMYYEGSKLFDKQSGGKKPRNFV